MVGGVVAWRALSRGRVTRAPETQAPFQINTEGFQPDDEVVFDAFPDRTPIDEIVRRVKEALVGVILKDQPGWASSTRRLDGLVALYGERIRLMLDPDFEEWVSQVRRYGSEAPDSSAEFRERWEAAASRLAGVPLAISQLWSRPRWVGGVRAEAPETAISIAPSITGEYPMEVLSPEASGLDVYEIIIPAGFKSRDAERYDNIVSVGMMFAWDVEHARWSPYRMTVYRPMSAFNGGWLLPPVF